MVSCPALEGNMGKCSHGRTGSCLELDDPWCAFQPKLFYDFLKARAYAGGASGAHPGPNHISILPINFTHSFSISCLWMPFSVFSQRCAEVTESRGDICSSGGGQFRWLQAEACWALWPHALSRRALALLIPPGQSTRSWCCQPAQQAGRNSGISSAHWACGELVPSPMVCRKLPVWSGLECWPRSAAGCCYQTASLYLGLAECRLRSVFQNLYHLFVSWH